jgi:hypothetical protein
MTASDTAAFMTSWCSASQCRVGIVLLSTLLVVLVSKVDIGEHDVKEICFVMLPIFSYVM